MAIRINPDTGIVEEQDGFINELFDLWGPVVGDDGEITRVNPETGELEEQSGFLAELFGLWSPKG